MTERPPSALSDNRRDDDLSSAMSERLHKVHPPHPSLRVDCFACEAVRSPLVREWATVYPELNRAHAALTRIAMLHAKRLDEHGGTWGECQECDRPWPCPTVELVEEARVAVLNGGSTPNPTDATGSSAPSAMSSNRRLDHE